jgi:phage FluMu protein Com
MIIKILNVKCQKCEKEWLYKGLRKFYVTCPDCKTSVKINRGLNGSETEGTSDKTISHQREQDNGKTIGGQK